MTYSTNNYCVILAGGKGKRLWPCSRETFPKQFIDFFGTGHTQLQQTYKHFAEIMPPDHILVNTHISYIPYVKAQLPDLPDDNLLAEPIHRNTAPSVLWAMHRILRECPDANVIITPSDQAVEEEDTLNRNMLEGLQFVSTHDMMLAIAVTPSRPEPGYGYIQMGDDMGNNVYTVKSFTEKPERDFAKMFINSGEFYWNTGIYLSKASVLLNCIQEHMPEQITGQLSQGAPDIIQQQYPLLPNVSLDSCILEKSDNVCMMKCDIGWADLGTWHSIYEAKSRGNDDNVVIDSDVMLDNSHGNVIKLPHGKLAVINGLDGYIVAEKDNVLLICKKEDSSALIRKFAYDVQIKKGPEYI